MDRIADRLHAALTDEELAELDVRLLFRSMRKGIGADHMMLQRLFGLGEQVLREQGRRSSWEGAPSHPSVRIRAGKGEA